MSTKFDDPMYLQAWVEGGKFPDIHNHMTYAAGTYMKGGRVLDLCSSYGLLAARLKKFYPEKFPYAIAVDGDPRVIAASKTAGLPVDELYAFMLLPRTQDTFMELITEHAIDCIVARRAFPELFSDEMGKGHAFGHTMAKRFHEQGVKEILIEGRVYSPRSTNSLSKLDNEIALFNEFYDHEIVGTNIALLHAKD